MVQRFYDQFFQKMSPERKARKLSVMKALARNTFKTKNKENEDPLNNNMALPLNLKHSTPLKSQKVTDLDVIEPDSEVELDDVESCANEESYISDPVYEQVTEPKLVITKIYDLENDSESSTIQDVSESSKDERPNLEICVPEIVEPSENTELERDEKHWRSLEVLDGSAEYEFCKSLEESKLYISTSSLLEEIEADLPSPYSLMRPLNHTFHTVTSYRTRTRLARMDSNLTCPEVTEQKEQTKNVFHMKPNALEYLEVEAMVQQSLARQAEKALSLSKTQKFMGVEHIESEKTLLLTNLRYNAAVRELEKMRFLGQSPDKESFGQITISGLEFLVDAMVEPFSGKFICTITEKENVQSTGIVDTLTKQSLYFEGPLKFQNLGKDFKFYIELFRLYSKETKGRTTYILNKLRKMTTTSLNKGLTGPRISNQGFRCVACAELRLNNITNREGDKCVVQFTESPIHPIIGNSVTLSVTTDVNIKSKQCGFLNVFQNTWDRRWYSQSGYFLESWLYPEDQEIDKPPIDSIYLLNCTSKARTVGVDVCVRPNCFVITLGDKMEDILFSADSQKDMLRWVDHLNLIIEHIHLWKPKV